MSSRTTDNRDTEQMYGYLEARIDVLKRRISELERENQILRDDAAQEEQLLTMSEHISHTPAAASQRIAG